MDDLAALLYALAAVLGALGSAVAVVINALRARRKRPEAVRGAIGLLAEAAKDGEITRAELLGILEDLRADGAEGSDST